MAKQGDKNRIEGNAAHLKLLQQLLLASNVAYILVRLLLRRSTVVLSHYLGLGLTTVLFGASYGMIAKALAPHYGAGGEVVYAGADPKTQGVLEYCHDVLYVALGVQLLACLTDWAWLALLVVPAYALWQAKGMLWSSRGGGAEPPESDVERRRREKRERQEARASKFAR